MNRINCHKKYNKNEFYPFQFYFVGFIFEFWLPSPTLPTMRPLPLFSNFQGAMSAMGNQQAMKGGIGGNMMMNQQQHQHQQQQHGNFGRSPMQTQQQQHQQPTSNTNNTGGGLGGGVFSTASNLFSGGNSSNTATGGGLFGSNRQPPKGPQVIPQPGMFL